MNPRHIPKKPWDINWVLHEDRSWEYQDPLGLPPISWGSPRLTREAAYDRLHQLNGTWALGYLGTGGRSNPRSRGSSFHSLADLEDSEVLTDPPVASLGVEPSGHLSDPAVSNRPIVRAGIPARPSRLIRGRSSDRVGTPPVPIYTSVYNQLQLSPTLWTQQTPVSGGTGLSVTSDYPRTRRTRPGGCEDFTREVGSQLRRRDLVQDWPEHPEGRTPEVGSLQEGPTEVWPKSTRTTLTCQPRPGVVWKEEVISWTGSSGKITKSRLKRETYC